MRDYTDDLAAVENSLRALIERIGGQTYGVDYLVRMGVTKASLQAWQKSRDREAEHRGAGVREERLLYFSLISLILKELSLRIGNSFSLFCFGVTKPPSSYPSCANSETLTRIGASSAKRKNLS